MITDKIQAAESPFWLQIRTRLRAPAPSRKALLIWVVALFSIGFLLRITVLLGMGEIAAFPHPETVNVAISLATTGKFADAYGRGSGPTAHFTPLFPLWLSVLIRMFGTGLSGAVAMKVAASAASALAFALLPVLSYAIGLPFVSGAMAGVAGELLLLNFWFQVSGVQDVPYTAAVFVGLCIYVCRIRNRSRFTLCRGAMFGIVAGLACLLSPALLPPILGWLAIIIAERRKQWRQMLVFAPAAAACFVATLTPWAVRNYRALGAPIVTRSNFWMELNISNNDSLTADEQRDFEMPEFLRMHPSSSPAERAKVKSMGEVAYNRIKRKQVLTWIATHKQRFLVLTAQRFWLFWMPRMKRRIESISEAGLTALSLSGLVLLFRVRVVSTWIFVAPVALFPCVYYLIMANARFRLPLEPFLFLLATYCVFRIAGAIERQWRRISEANMASVRQ